MWSRAAVLALTVGVAGCSGDTSRFGDGNNRGGYPDSTGSLPPGQAAPVGRVESQPLPPQASQAPPAQSSIGASSAGIAGGGRGMASYSPTSYGSAPVSPPRPPAPATPEVTGSVAAPPPKPAASNWSWDGGTAVTVGQGETVETIARRYGVPASAIMQANNITAPGVIHPGQQLVIPRYSQSSAAAAPPAAVAPVARPVVATPKPASTPVPAGPKLASVPSNPGVHVVAPGDTLSKIARLYRKPVHEIAKANNIIVGARLNVGDRLVIPGVHTSAVKPNMTPKPAPVVAQAKPVTSTVPAVGVSSPPMTLSKVLLPQPDGPIRHNSSPRATSKEVSSSARTLRASPSSPKRCETCLIRMAMSPPNCGDAAMALTLCTAAAMN